MKEFPDSSFLKQTGREERVRGRRKGREGEKEQQAGLIWHDPFRGQQCSMQVPLISPDSQTQSWTEAGAGKTAKMKC